MYWFNHLRTVTMFTLLSMCSERVLAGTQVVTYVFKTQEERESTRFTLTEWLRIKERMKLMDLWLALVSPPKQPDFRPELALGWMLLETDAASAAGTRMPPRERREASLFLTNIVSTSLGVRTLNIDFGLEAQDRRNTGLARVSSTALAATTTDSSNPSPIDEAVTASSVPPECRHGAMQFRIFGKNVQDSALVLKYGRFAATDPTTGVGAYGRMLGASTNLYLLTWLGLEGQATRYDTDAPEFSAPWTAATLGDYGAFIEISVLRLSGGVFQEKWQDGSEDASTLQRKGYFSGVRLLL